MLCDSCFIKDEDGVYCDKYKKAIRQDRIIDHCDIYNDPVGDHCEGCKKVETKECRYTKDVLYGNCWEGK